MAMRRNVVRNEQVNSAMASCATRLKPLTACIRALVAGGLMAAPIAQAELPQVLPGGRWQGALDPRIVNGGTDMLIQQIERNATLDWQTFNIGAGHGVQFNQPSSSSVALNRIHTLDPSVINGRLTANGQVYLINRNGILFGNHAQVDVNTLIASTLDIDDTVFAEGIPGAIQNGEAAFIAGADMDPDATIEILDGARLSANQGIAGRIVILAPHIVNGGDIETPEGQAILAAAQDRVYLAQSGDTDLRGLLVEVQTGGDVRNVGSIVAERGNVSILGLSVNQGGVVRATSSVTLNGSIRLVAGDNGGVDESARLDINTARARSVNGQFFEERGGKLVLGAGSVTEVLPAGSERAADDQSQPGSFVDLAGRTVTLEGGSRVTVTGGELNILAKSDPDVAFGGVPGEPEAGVGVRIESGAHIDVSGDTSTVVSVARNVIEVEARGTELADSPLQRDGAIRNQTLAVDIREGTPFLNIEGAQAKIQRGVSERFSAGGSVNIASTGDVVIEDEASIDIRGGQVTYTDGTVATSKLVTADGRVFDIADADPHRTYVGVLGGDLTIDYEKWGVSRTFLGGLSRFEQGYIEGKDAGTLRIDARRLAFNGDLIAGSNAGMHQRLAPGIVDSALTRPFDQRAHGGSMLIDLSSTLGVPGIRIAGDEDLGPAPARGETVDDATPAVLSTDMLAASRVSTLAVDTTGTIAIDRAVELPENSALRLSAGRIDVNANIRSAGGTVIMDVLKSTGTTVSDNGIVVPNTDVALRVAEGISIDVSGRWSNDSPRLNPEPSNAPIVTDGGSIVLNSGGDLTLAAGSLLDVSAGAHLTAAGRIQAGSGGVIGLASTDNRSGLAKLPTRMDIDGELRGFAFDEGGELALGANEFLIADPARIDSLLAERLPGGDARYSLSGNGPLRSLIDAADGTQTMLVDPELFRSGGFSRFDLTATRGGLAVADATRVVLRAENRIVDSAALVGFISTNPSLLAGITQTRGNGNPLEIVPTGTALDAFTRTESLPEGFLQTPVDLGLFSENSFGIGIDQAYPVLDIGSGAAIIGDPGAHIELGADTGLYVDGLIHAPAGAIALGLDTSFNQYVPQQMIWLGPQAQLSAPGAVVLVPNDLGLRLGEVLDAGTIALTADFGSIVTAAGSRIGVDGVATTLDLPTIGGAYAPTEVAGRAGTIHLTAAESILLQGDLSGRAAQSDAIGGALTVTLDPTRRPSEQEEATGDAPVPLAQRYPSGPRSINLAGYTGVLPTPGTALPSDINGQAFIAPGQIVAGGFDALTLTALTPGSSTQPDRPESAAMIRFTDAVDLHLARGLVLDAPVLSTAGADVRLRASYIALGSTDTRFRLDGATPIDGGGTLQADPSGGAGRLRLEAGLIDLVGDSVLQGFGGGGAPAAELVSRGDIRLRGTRLAAETDWQGSLRAAGDLRLQAQQTYPTTLSDFRIAVEADDGTLDLRGQSGIPGQPLSAGGRIELHADNIVVREGARVRAPLGEIALTGDHVDADGVAMGARSITLETGSLLSVSAAGLSIPFGSTQFQEDLVLDVTGVGTLQFVAAPDARIEKPLPEKRIALSADAIDVQPGATFDLSGGGDVRAVEFIPGPGGSKDILMADLDTGAGIEANDSFAILPLLGSEYAAYDPIESPAARNIQGIGSGSVLVLDEGMDGLPAGRYAILPARYALFGGYLVTPLAGSHYLPAGRNLARLDGSRVLAGRYAVAGSAVIDNRTQGFAIEDGARVRLRAEYAESSLDTLFADQSVRTPRDAGTLSIAAGAALRLAGTLTPTTTGGRGSAVDIVANELSIISRPNGGAGIELLASDLAGLNADSLLIGATRTLTADGLVIDPRAARIDVEAGVDLETRELILVADRLNLGTGSTQPTRLTANGSASGDADPLIVAGNAAVAMVSTARGATLTRDADATPAELNVAEGVTLSAPGSIVLDANGDVNLAGTLDAAGATLALGGASVSLGETDGLGLSGLVLSNADLARLSGSDLSLRSGGALEIVGTLADAGNAHAFERLAIDAQGIVGRANAGTESHLAADELVVRNSTGVALAAAGDGTGALNLQAERILLDRGAFAVSGYDAVTLRATDYMLAQGMGTLNVTGALTLDAPVITATGGADRAIVSSGLLTVGGGVAQAALPQPAGLGARLSLEGAAIAYSGNTLLPSGDVRLTADGNVTLDAGSNIDVAGRDADFAGHIVGTPGGLIRIESRNAGVTVAAGAGLDVSGATSGGGAGRIELIAPNGTLALAPSARLRAADGGERRGELVIDAGVLASTDAAIDNVLTSLNDMLEAGGFRGRRDLRVRSGDLHLALGEAMRAGEIKLTADSGRIVIDGTLDTSGADGGSIVLAAGDSIDVNGVLDAHATNADGDGGRVELSAVDADGDDLADGTRDDVVDLNAGSLIDVRGGVNGKGGSVLVRAQAFDADANGSREAVALGAMDATVLGAARADVEAVHAVTDSLITTADMDLWRAMLDQFMADNTVALPASWRLVPGLEVSSAGDIMLQNAWDFYANVEDADPANDWRFGADNDIPGILTLRAGGSVHVNQSLSDLFVDDIFLVAGSEVPYERLGLGESWRYRIVAGADSASADVLATTAHAAGDILLANNAKIRTGSGDIELAAARHIDLGTAAAIYTAGLNSGFGPLGDMDVNLAAFENIVFFPDFDIRSATGEEFLLAYLNKGQFPVDGGDIRIATGGDLRGRATQVNTTDWQPRLGGDFTNGSGVNFQNLPTHWAIAFERFVNGVGALGGGDVSARIGGDLRDLAVALPTTGKPDDIEIVTNTSGQLAFAAAAPTPRVNGGGDLRLDVAGDLLGGALQIDRGDARVRIDGDLGDAAAVRQPYFAIADTRLQVEARGSMRVGGVFNSTALLQSGNLAAARFASASLNGNYDPLFYTFTPTASVELANLTGDVLLGNPSQFGLSVARALYPPTLKVRSHQGGIVIGDATGGDLQTYPAALGQLELLADGDIRHASATGNNTIIQSDADAAQLPGVTRVVVPDAALGANNPLTLIEKRYLTQASSEAATGDEGRRFHAADPVHTGDAQPNRIVSRNGSIAGKAGPLDAWEFILAKQTRVGAGEDIRDMSFKIQHIQDTDISVLAADDSIVQTLSRNPNNGSFTASRKIIEIAGPGRLDVIAGQDIDLGTSRGIVSVGNTANPALADTGADIGLLAGMATAPDYDAFITAYLEESAEYLGDLNRFLAARAVAAGGDPVGAFRALSRAEQRELLFAILFNELKESGNAASASVNRDYSRGFAAIATLFPDAETRGDIATPVSVVKTVDGGSIALLAPYGDINAGATFRTLEKMPDELGVITGRGGDIDIYLDGDLKVNRERVFALQGDLLVWSSNGSIDAGKGAKTVTSAPDPIVNFDPNGNAVVTFPPAVDGSGLNAINAFLFAPRGAINAGDAGIRTSGNLTIGAVEVIGTDNIDVGGVSVGVPASASVPAGVVDAGSLSSSATSTAQDSTSGIGGGDTGVGGDTSSLAILRVELLGFGEVGGGQASQGAGGDNSELEMEGDRQ
jgi:filamentous hemagglutinin family protein